MYHSIACRLSAVSRWLTTPRNALCAALLVGLPTLLSGFFFDDFLHLLTLRGEGLEGAPMDLFNFAGGDPTTMGTYIVRGPFPWYAAPELKIHFFRPLSSFTMWLDHQLFGETAALYHLHSILWYALLVWAVLLLFRRTVALPVAGLALLLYVLDEGHLLPVLWWSNRNALVSAAPAVLGLIAHLRWREEGWRPGLPLSLLGYALGLLAGETAVGIFGYLGAWELLRREPLVHRVRALLPALALAALYVVVYKWGGYGVRHSGVYLDPIGEWPAYLAAAPGRALDLLATQFLGLPVEIPVFVPITLIPLRVLAVAGLFTLVCFARSAWRDLDPSSRRQLAWLALGAAFATLPALATFPSGRLLILPSIGACAVLAALMHPLITASTTLKRPVRILALALITTHIALPPFAWLGASLAVPALMHLSAPAFEEVNLATDTSTPRRIICLFAADPYTGFYPDFMRRYLGYAQPLGWQTLSMAPFDHEITRTGENAFEMAIPNGEMLSTPFERLLRTHRLPFRPGDVVECDGFRVEILECGAWGPSRIRFDFQRGLDDPQFQFLAWQGGRLAPFHWPEPGQTVRLRLGDSYFAWPHFKKRLGLV